MCLPKLGLTKPCHFCFHSLGTLLRDYERKKANLVSCRVRDHMEKSRATPAKQRATAKQACEALLDLPA